MTHGTKDWGTARGDVFILTDDLAELADRLYSIDVYDRRGTVVYMDDFSRGLGNWQTATGGAGAAVALSTAYPKWPPFGVKLTAGSSLSRYAKISRYMDNWGADAMGLEVSVAFGSDFSVFTLMLYLYDGANVHYAACQLNDVDGKVYYVDEDGLSREAGDWQHSDVALPPYVTMKMVADFSTDKYIRLMVDRVEYDLSAYSMQVVANTSYRLLYAAFNHVGRSGSNDYCYVDGVILTQAES